MPRCPECAGEIAEGVTLCPHHTWAPDADWAASNRVFCDFIHRGVVPPTPPTGLLCPHGQRVDADCFLCRWYDAAATLAARERAVAEYVTLEGPGGRDPAHNSGGPLDPDLGLAPSDATMAQDVG